MLHVGRTEGMMEGKFPPNRKQDRRRSRKPAGAGRKSLQESGVPKEKLLESLKGA